MRPTAPMFPRSTRRSSIRSRPSGRRSEPLIQNATVVLERLIAQQVDRGHVPGIAAAQLEGVEDQIARFEKIGADLPVAFEDRAEETAALMGQRRAERRRRQPDKALQTVAAAGIR